MSNKRKHFWLLPHPDDIEGRRAKWRKHFRFHADEEAKKGNPRSVWGAPEIKGDWGSDDYDDMNLAQMQVDEEIDQERRDDKLAAVVAERDRWPVVLYRPVVNSKIRNPKAFNAWVARNQAESSSSKSTSMKDTGKQSADGISLLLGTAIANSIAQQFQDPASPFQQALNRPENQQIWDAFKLPFAGPSAPTQMDVDQPKKKGKGGRTTGRFTGKTKKKRKTPSLKKLSTTGAIFHTECGGTVKDADTCYIGYAPAMLSVGHALMGALLKRLFAMAHIYINSWTSYWENPLTHRIILMYRAHDVNFTKQGLQNNLTFNATNFKTFFDMVQGVMDLIPKENAQYVFYSIELQRLGLVDGGVDRNETIARIDLTTAKFLINVDQRLMVQNVTPGGTEAVPINDEDNITINPLKFRIYTSKKKWLAGLDFKIRNDYFSHIGLTEDLYPENRYWRVNHSNGIMLQTNTANQVAVGKAGRDLFRTLFKGWEFEHNIKTSTGTLDPGSIKKARLQFKAYLTFDKWVDILKLSKASTITYNVDSHDCQFGHFEMLGFAPSIDNREATKPKVKVTWELESTYTGQVFCRPPRRTLVHNTFNDTAITLGV